MWLSLTEGFISIVEDKEDATRLAVRGRRRKDVIAFLGKDSKEIINTKEGDYQWRIYLQPIQVAMLVAHHVFSIKYTNFKNTVKDPDLTKLYSETWSAGVRNLDQRSPDEFWAAINPPEYKRHMEKRNGKSKDST